MDRDGFRKLLEQRKLDEAQIAASIDIAESYEQYLLHTGAIPGSASLEDFCRSLIHDGKNTYDNLLALARYGRFIDNNDVYIGAIELLDGAEVQPNLYKRVAESFSERIRDQAFAGIGISPMGLPSTDKPFDMFPVIDRLVSLGGNDAVEQLLSPSLRDLPDEYYLSDVEKYNLAGNIDEYLKDKHNSLVQELERCQQEGSLFFTQEINQAVIDYVRERPETESGVRQGRCIYITKIPYNTIRYLVEFDPTLKRYFACHCPWAREAIKEGNISLDPIFCNCSAGFSKKPWEVIFGQPLKVEMLESAIKGNFRCRFVVYLPANIKVD